MSYFSITYHSFLILLVSISMNFLVVIEKTQAQTSVKQITPNDVYAQVMLISDELHFLLNYFNLEHDHEGIIKRYHIQTLLKPRITWQKTYEIMIKINILRSSHQLPIIEPVNMEPVLQLNPDMVYEQTQRILTEIRIFKFRQNIHSQGFELKTFSNKTPLDVYNALAHISVSFDELNRSGFTPSYVFGETMRIYNDLSTILQHLGIQDKTIPSTRNDQATPNDTFDIAMKILNRIKLIQVKVGIEVVDFSVFVKKSMTSSDVFTMSQMIIAELQTIKAYFGLKNYITPAASRYTNKTPADVDQLMNWNLRKLSLIYNLGER